MNITNRQSILYHIILHCFEVKGNGLFNGKMGIALSLASYSKTYACKPVEDLAEALLTRALNSLSCQTTTNFAHGLAGIGWGIEYLAQNGFFNINTADICSEIDKKIESINLKHITDFSLEYGFLGILTYINAHIYGNPQNNPFKQETLKEIENIIKSHNHININGWHEQCNFFMHQTYHKPYKYQPSLNEYILYPQKEILDINDLSLRTGASGYLISTYG